MDTRIQSAALALFLLAAAAAPAQSTSQPLATPRTETSAQLKNALRLDTAEAVPTGRLPRTVVPAHVSLALKMDPAQARYTGTVTLDVKVSAATRTVWMHGKGLTVSEAVVTQAGRPPAGLTVEQVDVSGVLKLKSEQPIKAGRAQIVMRFDAPYGKLQGAYRVKAGGEDYVVTQMEAIGAREAFPGFDEPSFKQAWDISLEIPEALQGVANTRQVSSAPTSAGWKKLTFATTEALPSYLLAFAVGPWDIVEAAPIPANAVRHTPLALRGIAPRGQGGRMRYALENTAAIVAAEEAYFDIPYPFDKLDILAAPDFAAGAMENAGLIVYRDSLLYANENSSVEQRQRYWGTHAHELAHQWFGDHVTMPWWDDVWLNEAFATWMAAKIVDQLKPEHNSGRGMMEGALRAMREDSLSATRRIHEPISNYTDIGSAFDGITYQKGGAVLSMFERHMGPERFRAAIRSYMRKHARGNATSKDLIAALAAESREPAALRRSFASFLDQPGVPMLQVQVQCNGPKPALHIEQKRFLPVGSKAPSQGLWDVPMCVRWADSAGEHTQCDMLRGRQTTVSLRAASCPAWVMPSADGAGYYRFSMAADDAAKLEAHFDRLNEREQRAYADSTEAAFQAGALDLSGFMRAARRLATSPTRETAIAPARTLQWALTHLAESEARREGIRALAREIYAPHLARLGTEPRAEDRDEDGIFRRELLTTLVDLGRDPALRLSLAQQGRLVLGLPVAGSASPGDGQLHPGAVSANHRGLALRMAAEEGDATVFDALLAAAAGSEDAVLRGELLGAAASAKHLTLQQRARELALTPKVRRNEIALLLPGARRRGGGGGSEEDAASLAAARAWVDANFDALVARVAPAGAQFVGSASQGLCSEAGADALEARYAEKMSQLEGGPRALAQTTENIRLCGALQGRHKADAWPFPS